MESIRTISGINNLEGENTKAPEILAATEILTTGRTNELLKSLIAIANQAGEPGLNEIFN